MTAAENLSKVSLSKEADNITFKSISNVKLSKQT